jgi:FkbM family methyltransferase
MVAVSRRRVKGNPRRRLKVYDKAKLLAVTALVLCLSFLAWNLLAIRALDVLEQQRNSPPQTENRWTHPDLRLNAPNSEQLNAIALDILRTLDCKTVFNQTKLSQSAYEGQEEGNYRRRLDEVIEEEGQEEEFMMDDTEGYDFEYQLPTAVHLFCLAAYSPIDEQNDKAAWYWKKEINCDATNTRQRTLLELWSTARAEFPDTNVLRQVLQTTIEQERLLLQDHPMVHVWAPYNDDGIEFVFSILSNANKNADEGGIYGLTDNLGPNKLFVDVGSCLGFTSMAMSLLYPGTRILSIEAAPPNWLVQQINWKCWDPPQQPTVLLAGVGPVSGGPQFSPVRWRHNATTSVRGWSPKSQAHDDDVELNIKLTPWHSLLTEAGIESSRDISVLNVDCEGCEYNFIPALTQEEFDSIPTVMGEVHWGYIPESKKPSSKRGRETHQRLCVHENFARTAKECCAFPDLPVKSSVPGKVLIVEEEQVRGLPYKSGTVKDIAGELCDDFETWKVEKHLDSIASDWGWFQFTSIAEDDV